MTEFLQHLVNGLSLGTIYALIALGYTMVYGVLKLINFAHGDVYMVGAFAGYYLGSVTGTDRAPGMVGAALVTLGAMAICGALGYVIERFAYRPLRNRARLTALITAIGVSFLLEYGFQLSPIVRSPVEFPPGPSPRFFPALLELGEPLTFLGVTVPRIDLLGLLVALLLMIGLQLIVYRTRFGMAMRAASFDPQVAGLMGIPVNRIISWTFVLGSALAAAAGIINASSRPKIEPLFGLMSGLKAFVAAVLGGIGSVPGAMVGGLVLGLTEEYVAGYTSSQYRDAIAFTVLILVLLVRPEGLFGRATVEKV
ncbi:inner-membrane translocator [Anaeromyxobacter sp. K]|uniref:Inner-membrane translocator n=1 Tax=Anaeromyxobacter dehalogenans (strain ATCC BAA-258 / DSM 21875 / 2CP-1) TaxID=455488 RepID=B8JCL2_ANAD2|nr:MULTISPECIES: branched-chain amino acid ABC transporter permease [Anaeromyxobacter]ACG75597.1 inner-membrane translocator [Anaeromyxobacter sp. K]ACL67732.1 inner-membrane translocator [Anaeromyxobacter dehalogenans 2CP-1]